MVLAVMVMELLKEQGSITVFVCVGTVLTNIGKDTCRL